MPRRESVCERMSDGKKPRRRKAEQSGAGNIYRCRESGEALTFAPWPIGRPLDSGVQMQGLRLLILNNSFILYI